MTSHGIEAPEVGRSDGGIRPLRICVVANHDDTLARFTRFFEVSSHVVLSYRTMASALEGIPAVHADVLIADVALPDGNGWLLLERLGASRPALSIVLSGFDVPADPHHLVKPPSLRRIEALLIDAARPRPPM